MEIREFYDKIAKEYSDAVSHPTTASARKLEQNLTAQLIVGKRYNVVIDIGCGDSPFLRDVEANNKIGIDVSVEMIKLNSRHLPSAIYVLGEFPDIPLQHNLADLIHASFILDHIENIEEFFAKISRLLKRNGHFVLAEFNPESMLNFRGHEETLRYRSSTGEIYEANSNFNNLINLEDRLKRYFRLKRVLTAEIGIGGIKINHYLMRKK